MHKLLYYLCLSVCYAGITYALPDGEIIGREVELKTCQTIGKSLINLCVINPAPDPKTCTPLYAGYVACITKLNSPRPLVYNKSYDDYVLSAYSPCGYEISHLVLSDNCTKEITDGVSQ